MCTCISGFTVAFRQQQHRQAAEKEEEEGRASTETKQLTYFQSTYLEDSQSFSTLVVYYWLFSFSGFFLLYDSAHSCDCLISFPITLQNSELFDNFFFVVPFHVIFLLYLFSSPLVVVYLCIYLFRLALFGVEIKHRWRREEKKKILLVFAEQFQLFDCYHYHQPSCTEWECHSNETKLCTRAFSTLV